MSKPSKKNNSASVALDFHNQADAERFYFNNLHEGSCNGTTVFMTVEGDVSSAKELVAAARNARGLEKPASISIYRVEAE